MHIALSPGPLPPTGGRNPGLPLSEGASRFSAPRCVWFCRVLAVGLLAFGAEASDGPRPTTRTRLPSGPQRRPPSSPWARATGAARARPRARRRWHPSAARGSPSPSTRRTPRASAAPRPGLATRGGSAASPRLARSRTPSSAVRAPPLLLVFFALLHTPCKLVSGKKRLLGEQSFRSQVRLVCPDAAC